MTPGGYISDRRCPGNPEHGIVISYESGHYCPHSDHTTSRNPMSQSWWSDEQFEAAKSANPPPNKIPMKRARR